MVKGPGLYTEIGKKARDLLYKDYQTDHKFTLTTFSPTGVTITSSGTKKGEFLAADVNTQLKNKNITTDIKVDTSSNLFTTITVDEAAPGLKTIFSFKVPDQRSGKVEVQYLHEYAAVSSSVGLTVNPTVNFSGVIGTNVASLGTDLSFDTKTGDFIKCNAGVSLSKVDLIASLTLNNKGDSLNASYYHIVNPLTAVGAEVSHSFSSNENTITVGAQHSLDPLTTLKARVNNAGKASALVQHEWRPKSFFTVSGEVDTKAIEKTAKVAQFVTSFQYHKYFTSKPNMEKDNSQAFSDEYADNTSFKGGICGPIAASMNESMFLLVISRWQNAFEGLKVTHDYKFLSAAGALMRIMIRMLDLVLKLLPGDSKEPLTARILLYKLFYDQTDQGMTQFLLSLIKSFDTHKQTKSDLSDLVEMIHLIVRLMENLQTRGTLRVSKKSRSRKKKILSDKTENVNEQCDAEGTIEDPTSLSNSEQSTVLKKKSPEIATSGDEENMNVDVLEKPEISVPEMENLGNNLQTEKKKIDIDDLSRSSDDSSGDEQPAANNEVDFKVSTFISSLANHSIIQNLCWLLGFYKNNSVSTNHYIVCMLQRITDDLDLSPMLYQLSLLTTFYDILEEQKSCPCKEYANIVDFLTSLVRRMLRKMKNQPLLFVEVLFWKSRKECHYINAEYMLHELGHLKKESAGWGNASANEDIGSSQGKIWAPRSIADALGEDEADVVIPHEPGYQSGGDAAEHESVSVPRRKRRFVLTEEMEMKIKDLYEKFKDDENCSRLIAESLDPDGQVSPAQVINKLKQLGLKVALKKRKRSGGRPFSTNPDRLGENGEIIEKESNLRISIDLEGSLPRLSTRRRVRAFNKDQEEMIKALFEQFKDHRRCSYMIANALGSDNSFTAAQVSRKLKQLGLRAPRQKHSDTDIHLRDEELNDFSVGQNSDDETLLSLKNRSKNKDDGVLFGDELPSQNIEGESSDSDDELLCSILKPKNNAGGRLFVGEQNNEGEISDNSDNEILSSKINKTKKLLSKAKGKELRTESEMPGEDAGDEALNDLEQRDRGREFTGRDVAGIEEDIVPDHVSKESASEAEAIDSRSGKSTGVSPVNYVDNTTYEQMDDALEDLEDAAASDTVVTSARLKRKLRMVVDLEDDDD